MKTEQQVINLLSLKYCKSINDWEVIRLFCQRQRVILRFFQPSITPELGITLTEFVEWFENGFGDGDIVGYKNGYAVITLSDLKECHIDGYLENGIWILEEGKHPLSDFQKLDPDDQARIDTQLSRLGMEFSYRKNRMGNKYVPVINERVRFYNVHRSGLGVIRSINPDLDEVELYCYYFYDTKELGYNMHEKGVVTYHGYHFEPMSIPASRRLNTELERVGKVWYDKLHRIEPVKAKVEKGKKYWYISDKMKLVEDVEKGTPTSNFRYIAGNYFLTYAEGLEYLGRICDILRDRLAK